MVLPAKGKLVGCVKGVRERRPQTYWVHLSDCTPGRAACTILMCHAWLSLVRAPYMLGRDHASQLAPYPPLLDRQWVWVLACWLATGWALAGETSVTLHKRFAVRIVPKTLAGESADPGIVSATTPYKGDGLAISFRNANPAKRPSIFMFWVRADGERRVTSSIFGIARRPMRISKIADVTPHPPPSPPPDWG